VTVALVPVNPLVAYDVLAAIGVLVCVAIIGDRPRPTPRIVARPEALQLAAYRTPVTTPPARLEDWLTVPGPAVWSAGNRRPINELQGQARFPDPRAPRFVRQPRLGADGRIPLTTSVALAWDRWENRRTVYVVRGLPVDHHAHTQQLAVVA
jgi:hypothetical protein